MRYLSIFILFFIITVSTFSLRAEMRGNCRPFLENAGQMKDSKGRLASNILFKTGSKDLNIYITTKGLTFVYLEAAKNEEEEKREKVKDAPFDGGGEEVKTYSYLRNDMILSGAMIKKENIIRGEAVQGELRYLRQDEQITTREYTDIIIEEIYKGIDWKLYLDENKNLKYEFIVHPEGNPDDIEILFTGASLPDIEKSMITHSFKSNKLIDGPLECFTQAGKELNSNYRFSSVDIDVYDDITKEKLVYAKAAAYKVKINVNHTNKQTTIIDPALYWNTVYGGATAMGILAIEADELGNVFYGGYTWDLDFPVLDNSTYFQGSLIGTLAGALIKFTESGRREWATYVGEEEVGISGLALDENNNLFVIGGVGGNFFIPFKDIGTFYRGTPVGSSDGFVLKFDNEGVLLWGTYLGGSNNDALLGITCDHNNNVIITGQTSSSDFPIEPSGYYEQPFTNTNAIANPANIILVKFDNIGNLLWSTYYGCAFDGASDVAVDSHNNIYCTGKLSGDKCFKTLNAGQFHQLPKDSTDGFILKFSPVGELKWATAFGGTGRDGINNIAINEDNYIYITGSTTSKNNFPLENSGGYFQPVNNGGGEVFIAKFDTTSKLLWSTFFWK